MDGENPILSAVVGVLVVALTVTALVLYAFRSQPEPPPHRMVRVVLEGVDMDTPLALRLGDEPLPIGPEIELGVHAAPSHLELSWFLGPGCGASCPGRCPAWCATGVHSIEVRRGEGPLIDILRIEPPTERPVLLSVDAAPTLAQLDGATGAIDAGSVRFEPVPPGSYELHVEVGACPAASIGCTSAGDICPKGCISWVQQVVVPVGEEPVTIDLSLSMPAPPPPIPRPTRRRAVTGSAYAGFVRTHPEWERETAIAAGRADARYLKRWAPGPPPGPATQVPWAAARDYCADRGGLADLQTPPLTWSRDSGPTQEWRQQEGRPAWRRFDGETSLRTPTNKAFSFTGFRCAR